MDTVTKMTHRLGWCDPGQARFWNREEPSHRCPSELGTIVCSCPCHQGIAPDQVNQDDQAEKRRRAERLASLVPRPEPEPEPKKKPRFKRKPWSR